MPLLRESLAVPRLNIQSNCHPGTRGQRSGQLQPIYDLGNARLSTAAPRHVALSTSQIPPFYAALSFVVAGLGFLGYRWLSRGERIDRKAALTTIAGA